MNEDSQKESVLKQPRATKKRERTRADLLAAARKVFAARGFHNASILDITTAANVGVGTFYLHFRDKDEAFETLIEEVLNGLQEQITADVYRQGEPSLPVIIRLILYHAYEQRDLFRIALTGGGIFTRTFHVQDMIAQGITPTLERQAHKGYLEYETVPLLASLITGVVAQGIVWWFEQDEPTPEVMIEQVLKLLAHGLPTQLFAQKPALDQPSSETP